MKARVGDFQLCGLQDSEGIVRGTIGYSRVVLDDDDRVGGRVYDGVLRGSHAFDRDVAEDHLTLLVQSDHAFLPHHDVVLRYRHVVERVVDCGVFN